MRNFITIIESASAESGAEDISDIIHDFANKIGDGNFNEIYADDDGPFPQLFIGGYTEDGFSKQYALATIQPLVEAIAKHGWFLAKAFEVHDPHHDDPDSTPQIMIYCGFLPNRGERELVPQKVYHISPRTNREEILKHGIRASKGGSDFIQTDHGRVYVILDDIQIDSIKRDIIKHRGQSKKWSELDVWVIDAWSVADEWYSDLELDGVAAWTPQDIPASAIGLH